MMKIRLFATHRRLSFAAFWVFLLSALYYISTQNYLLFHSLVEIYSILIGFAIFIIAWNAQSKIDNHYFVFVGIAFLFVGFLALLHTLAYKGMGVFTGAGANLPTQLWIATRYMFSVSLLVALFFTNHKSRSLPIIVLYTIGTGVLLMSVFYWKNFPTAYVEGTPNSSGYLTTFKIASEYIIALILVCSIFFLIKNRQHFDKYTFQHLTGALIAAVATGMAFTLYTDVYGLFNFIGHLLNLISFYLIYLAMIKISLTRPFDSLWLKLKQSEASLKEETEKLSTINKLLAVEIDNHKKSKEELEKVVRKNEELTEKLDVIGSLTRHDVGNKLSIISSYVYLLKKSADKKVNSDYLKVVESTIDSAQKILDFGRSYQASSYENLYSVDVEKTFNDAVHLATPTVNIEVVTECKGIKVHADSLLEKIFYNLIDNSIRHGKTVTQIKLSCTVEKNALRLIYEDNGIGIPDDKKRYLFTKGYSTSGNSGLGLFLIKKIIDIYGWKITEEGKPGQGVKFVITIPTHQR
ncbi:MAG: ATP-binding protein [Candidatus Bathyarchaeota archaeon]|nr:ATP-binding protein [Candidatus Bathyarchaeota archaeon]